MNLENGERDAKMHVRVFGCLKERAAPGLFRAVNGAMVEVSGKTQHSEMAGVAWV